MPSCYGLLCKSGCWWHLVAVHLSGEEFSLCFFVKMMDRTAGTATVWGSFDMCVSWGTKWWTGRGKDEGWMLSPHEYKVKWICENGSIRPFLKSPALIPYATVHELSTEPDCLRASFCKRFTLLERKIYRWEVGPLCGSGIYLLWGDGLGGKVCKTSY